MGGFRPANRENVLLRIALSGPAGSGKTMSALLMARGLVGDKGTIAVIDTERGRSRVFCEIVKFDVLELHAPYASDKFTQAVHAAQDYDVLVVDSLSHAWAGQGGMLDLHAKIASGMRSQNSYVAWRDVTPKQNELIETLLSFPGHLIATMRSKTAYAIVQENGKSIPKKIGQEPVQRQGVEYEFDIVGDMLQDHTMIVTKNPPGVLDGWSGVPSKDTGETLRAYVAKTQSPVKESRALSPPAVQIITGAKKTKTLDALKQYWRDNTGNIEGCAQWEQDQIFSEMTAVRQKFEAAANG